MFLFKNGTGKNDDLIMLRKELENRIWRFKDRQVTFRDVDTFRRDIKADDFWWVSEYIPVRWKKGNGYVAVPLYNIPITVEMIRSLSTALGREFTLLDRQKTWPILCEKDYLYCSLCCIFDCSIHECKKIEREELDFLWAYGRHSIAVSEIYISKNLKHSRLFNWLRQKLWSQ